MTAVGRLVQNRKGTGQKERQYTKQYKKGKTQNIRQKCYAKQIKIK